MNKYLINSSINQDFCIPKSYLNVDNIQWEGSNNITPYGGLVFFSNFLKVSGIFKMMIEDCPFEYTSNNSPQPENLIGTIICSIICGCKRFSHINHFRNDSAIPKLLGFEKIISEDSVRRALKNCNQQKLDEWLTKYEQFIYKFLIKYDYIIDIDNTVKPIYGHQEGAEIGYNPSKQGRPNLNYHSYFIGAIRLVLGIDVLPGKQSSSTHGIQSLLNFLDTEPTENHPRLVRGDIGYGNDKIMSELEKRNIKYLFKLKRTTKVSNKFKELLKEQWSDCGAGWSSIETTIKLSGWEKERKVLFVRRPIEIEEQVIEKKSRGRPKKEIPIQIEFDFFIDKKINTQWEYYILITNDLVLNRYELTNLYRERSDCENNFDELKNQWGWSGFMTKDIKSTRIMARLIAIIVNLWSVFCRLANPNKHIEPVTSRPILLYINARLTNSGRKTKIRLFSTHAQASEIQKVLSKINKILNGILTKCGAVEKKTHWEEILHYAFSKWLNENKSFFLKPGSQLLLPF